MKGWESRVFLSSLPFSLDPPPRSCEDYLLRSQTKLFTLDLGAESGLPFDSPETNERALKILRSHVPESS